MFLSLNKNFKYYYYSRNISITGDIFHSLVIMSLLLGQKNATSIMGILVAINAVVRVLTSILISKKVDKINEKKAMIYLDILALRQML
ncbi:hypothetical protein BBF96_11675 [Anoxybacter fermentans]|uniref:Uncharacterized protein n=1 Tax=Anoxybacter fermentans TaxID=1323375 RepID=A0A3Q9HRA1_9FIRM|nr:hypothetical protein [Anoxybacter fermentans]AZR73992.1 hypothetical protein BBF96_11675 [Anoxybacter fermentans]